MKRIYLVEGPDGAGKSTYIRDTLLAKHPEASVHHFGAPKPSEDQFLRYAEPLLKDPADVLIYDRSWYSEFIYGPIVRDRYELRVLHCRILEALVQFRGHASLIYITAPIDTLWQRCQVRGETYITSKEQLWLISREYERVMDTLPTLSVIHVK